MKWFALWIVALAFVAGLADGASAQVHNAEIVADARYSEGQQLWRQGKSAEALALYRAMCDEKPEDGTRYLQVATLLTGYSQFRAALPFAQVACERGTPSAQAYTVLGLCHLQTSQLKEADAVLREAVSKFPQFANLHFSLGLVCKHRGQLIESIGHYEKAVELAPTNSIYLHGIGEVWLLRSRYEEAEKFFRRALAAPNPHLDAMWRLGQTLGFLDQHKEAEEWFTKAIAVAFERRSPPHQARFHFAVYMFERERFEAAEQLLDVLVLDKPKHRMGWMYRGRVQKALGKLDEAKASMARYQELQKSEDARDERAKQERFEERKREGDGSP